MPYEKRIPRRHFINNGLARRRFVRGSGSLLELYKKQRTLTLVSPSISASISPVLPSPLLQTTLPQTTGGGTCESKAIDCYWHLNID